MRITSRFTALRNGSGYIALPSLLCSNGTEWSYAASASRRMRSGRPPGCTVSAGHVHGWALDSASIPPPSGGHCEQPVWRCARQPVACRNSDYQATASNCGQRLVQLATFSSYRSFCITALFGRRTIPNKSFRPNGAYTTSPSSVSLTPTQVTVVGQSFMPSSVDKYGLVFCPNFCSSHR